jgi:hypothetical protein
MKMTESKSRSGFTESGVFASVIPVDAEVKVSANGTFEKATTTDVVVGHAVTTRLTDGRGTVELYHQRKLKIVADAALAAGAYWKRVWHAGSGLYRATSATAADREGVVFIGGAIAAEITVFQEK